MARPNRYALSRSLALPRRPLRNVYPAVLRYGTVDAAKAHPEAVPRTDGLLDAAVDWAHYREGHRVGVCDFASAVDAAREGDGFVWLGLHEPSPEQLEQLGMVFSLHP